MPQHHLQHSARPALIISTAHLTSGENLSVSFHHNRMQSSSSPIYLTDSCSLFSTARVLSDCSYVSPSPGLPSKTLQTPNPGSVRGTAVPKREVLSWDNCSKEPAWVQEQTIVAGEVSVTAALVLTDFVRFTLY